MDLSAQPLIIPHFVSHLVMKTKQHIKSGLQTSQPSAGAASKSVVSTKNSMCLFFRCLGMGEGRLLVSSLSSLN